MSAVPDTCVTVDKLLQTRASLGWRLASSDGEDNDTLYSVSRGTQSMLSYYFVSNLRPLMNIKFETDDSVG